MSLLEVRNLRTYLKTRGAPARAVDGVDLTVHEGQAVGLVGESGSGKSVLALSILGLQPGGDASIMPGSSILFRGQELVGAGATRLRGIRGRQIAMVFQEPMTSLNPVFSVGEQIGETLRLHRSLDRRSVRRETVKLLEEVGFPDPEGRLGSYPHMLSGGLRQRAMIAMALAGNPSLLVADEPTTALDVTIQAQILRVLKEVQERFGMGLLLISHDVGLVAGVCSDIAVLYGGHVVEAGPTRGILESPLHPYTRGLLGSRLSVRDRRASLRPIPGEVPEATEWPRGCRFHPRCPEAESRCGRDAPVLLELGRHLPGSERKGGASSTARRVRCWLVEGGGRE